MASQSATVLLKASVVMPEWVAATISAMSFSPKAAIASILPESTDLNGSVVFHSGCLGASAFTSSSAKTNWV